MLKEVDTQLNITCEGCCRVLLLQSTPYQDKEEAAVPHCQSSHNAMKMYFFYSYSKDYFFFGLPTDMSTIGQTAPT